MESSSREQEKPLSWKRRGGRVFVAVLHKQQRLEGCLWTANLHRSREVMQVMENGPSHTMASARGDEPNSTKARLNGILESFQAFDSDMKTGTRVRREHDEHRIAQLTAELTRLEKTLNQEIKRRVEMNKSVQVVSGSAAGHWWPSVVHPGIGHVYTNQEQGNTTRFNSKFSLLSRSTHFPRFFFFFLNTVTLRLM